MIYDICNIANEHYLDTYHKVAIIQASQLPYFTHLTPNDTIEDYITNLPDSANVIITDLLPENIKVDGSTKVTASGRLYPVAVNYTQTPQDKALQELLETYNNQLVVVLVSKRAASFLYGTSAQPLLFTYDELNANNHAGIKGYNIKMDGEGYGPSKFFEEITFNIFSRGLAFQLAADI